MLIAYGLGSPSAGSSSIWSRSVSRSLAMASSRCLILCSRPRDLRRRACGAWGLRASALWVGAATAGSHCLGSRLHVLLWWGWGCGGQEQAQQGFLPPRPAAGGMPCAAGHAARRLPSTSKLAHQRTRAPAPPRPPPPAVVDHWEVARLLGEGRVAHGGAALHPLPLAQHPHQQRQAVAAQGLCEHGQGGGWGQDQ